MLFVLPAGAQDTPTTLDATYCNNGLHLHYPSDWQIELRSSLNETNVEVPNYSLVVRNGIASANSDPESLSLYISISKNTELLQIFQEPNQSGNMIAILDGIMQWRFFKYLFTDTHIVTLMINYSEKDLLLIRAWNIDGEQIYMLDNSGLFVIAAYGGDPDKLEYWHSTVFAILNTINYNSDIPCST